MMVLIDRDLNEEQLLLETFFPKMHIERDNRKKVIFRGLKRHKKAPGGGVGDFNMLFRTSFSNIFCTFAGSFCIFSPHLQRA